MRSPIPSPIAAYLQDLLTRLANADSGEVASYIPELAKANPDWFGIAIATLDGEVYEVGTTRQAFTIQSMSKPLVYGLAMEDLGELAVTAKVGVEPTGDAFNSISLEAGSGRPSNPMINAGAIAAASLVQGPTPEARQQRILDTFSRYAGRALKLDHAVYESERDTGHRNRAIGHMLRNYDIITEDPEPALDLYFRQCAVEVDCRDLALMAATLANGGQHPRTGERAIPRDLVAPVLSIMTTCGMYDFAGEWVYRVGMPAKSGVGGGIFAVLPGQLGIGVFSPRLDARGNSTRGVAVCRALSEDLGLHSLLPPRTTTSTIRASYTVSAKRSRRRRDGKQTAALDARGDSVRILELQGDLRFATLERAVRELVTASSFLTHAILDMTRVRRIDDSSMQVLKRLEHDLLAVGVKLLFTANESLGISAPPDTVGSNVLPDLDSALECCEGDLLAAAGLPEAPATNVIALADQSLCAGMNEEELGILETHLVHVTSAPGDWLVRRGDAADALFLIMAGTANVLIENKDGTTRRLATLTAGMGFGETALIQAGVRSADIRANTEVQSLVLFASAFAEMKKSAPDIAITLLGNLLASSHEITARLTREIAAVGA